MEVITPIPDHVWPDEKPVKNEKTLAHFNALLKEAGLKKTELGRILGVHGDTVSRWRDDPPQYAVAYLELYVGVKRLL